MGIAQTRLQDAESTNGASDDPDQGGDEAVRAAERDVAYLRREAGELTYELSCGSCGARYERSLPDLVHLVRHAGSDRVPLT